MDLYKIFKEEIFLVILSIAFLFGDTSQILAGKDKIVAFIDLTEEEPEGTFSSKKRVRIDESRVEELNDDVLLAAVEQTEKDFLLKQPQSTVLFKRTRLPGPESTLSPNDDAIFSSPEVLKVVDKAEAVYALEIKKESSQEKASGEISAKLLTTFQQHQDHLFTSIEKARRSILITSHSFSATLRSHGRLFEALHKSSLGFIV